MTHLSLPVRRFLAVSLLVLAVLSAWVLLARPLFERHRDHAERAEQIAMQLERYRQLAALLPELEKRKAEMVATSAGQGRLAGASDALAGAALQEHVKALAESKGLQPRSLQLLPAVAEGAFRRIPLRLQVVSSTPKLQALLHALEAGRPYLFIGALEISKKRIAQRSGEVAQEDELDVTLDVHGYRAEVRP